MDQTDKRRENPALLEDDRVLGTSALADAAPVAEAGGRAANRTNVHDSGSDANDTIDGLTESEEAVRHAAEDIPTGQDPAGSPESVPVFDRGSLPPKV